MLVPAVASLLALAQEPVPAPAEPSVEATPAPVTVERLGDRFVWEQRARLPSGLAADSVAVSPSGVWLVADDAGAVFRSDDKGSSWSRVLAGRDEEERPSDEEVLLEAETVRQEEFDSLEDATETEDRGDIDVEIFDVGAAETAVEEVREEVTARLANGETVEAAPAVVWIDPRDPAFVLAGRPDGVWRSVDEGRTWARATGDDAAAFEALGDAIVAGTSNGVSYSVDRGETWIEVDGAAGGEPVTEIVAKGGWLWAAGDAGLWRSRDALRWEPVEGLGAARVLTVLPDPTWEGGLWVATSTGLLRSDDDGQTFYPSGRQPLSDLRKLVHLGLAGHLLAITSDGVWESVDGGVVWTPAAKLLTEPDVRDVAFDGGLPVIATRSGVWRMIAPLVSEGAARRADFLPLYDAVRLAQSRAGLSVEPLAMARASTLAIFAPQLSVQFDYDLHANRDVDYVAISNGEDHDRDWSLTAKLCWGACSSTTLEIDSDVATVEEAIVDEDLFVMDGEIFSDDQVVSAAANVAQSIRAYRSHLAQVVGDAWVARQRLAREEGQTASLSLPAQVEHALRVMELDARLDAYTQGAWLGSLQTPQEAR